MRWHLKHLLKHTNEVSTEIDGDWVPARPINLISLRQRFRDAWNVLTEKADALHWPKNQ